MIRKIPIFNSPEEVGVRILFILDACQKRMSFQRIMYYDYFSLHLRDLDKTQESLHPDNPNHSSEIAIKRSLINKGLNLIIAKGLVEVRYTKTGIYYQSNHLTHHFISLFANAYVEQLKRNIIMVNEFFLNQTDKQIYKYVDKNIGKWAGEFEDNIFSGVD